MSVGGKGRKKLAIRSEGCVPWMLRSAVAVRR